MSRKRANLHVPTPVRTRVATLSPNPGDNCEDNGGSPDPLDSIPRGPIGSRASSPLEDHVPAMTDSDSQLQSTSVGINRGRGGGRGRGRGRGGTSRQTDRSVSTTSSTRITRNASSSRSISPIKSSLPLTTSTPTPRLASRYTSTSRSTSPIKPSPSLPATTPMLVQTQRNRPGLATRSSSRSISPIKRTAAATSSKPSRSSSPIKQSRSTSPVKVVASAPGLELDISQQQSKRKQAKSKLVENVKRKSSELPPDDDLSDDDDEEVNADVAEPMQKRRKVENEEDGQDANAEEKDEEDIQDVDIQRLDKAEDNVVEEINKEEEGNSSMGIVHEGKQGKQDNGGGMATNENKVEQGDEDDRDQELAPSPDSDSIEETGETPIDIPQMDDTGSQPAKTDTEGGDGIASIAQPDMIQDEVDDGAELSDSDEQKGEESADAQVVIDIGPVTEMEIKNNSAAASTPMHGAEKSTLQETVAESPAPAIATEGSITTNDNILPAATLGPIQAAQPDIPISEIETAGNIQEVGVEELEKGRLSDENETVVDERMRLDKEDAGIEEITVDGEIAANEEIAVEAAVQGSFTESRAGAGLPSVRDSLLEAGETVDNAPITDIVNAQEPSTAVAVEKETTAGDGDEPVDAATGGGPIEGEESIEIEDGPLSQAVGAEVEEEEEKETTDVKQTIDAVQGMDVDLSIPVESRQIAPDQSVAAPDALIDRSTKERNIETSVKADDTMDVDITVPVATNVTLAAGESAPLVAVEDDHKPAVEQRQQLPVEVNVTTAEEGDEGEEEIEQDQDQDEEMSATPVPAPAQTASPAKSSTSIATATTTTTGKGKNTTKTKKVAAPKKAITASNKKAAGVKGKKTKVEEIKGGEKGRSSSLSERSHTPQPSEEPSSSSLLLNSNGNTNSPSKNSPSKSAAAGGTSSCICRKSYDDDDEDVTWLGCESCDGWFHASCVGVQAEMVKMLDVFICKKCERTTAQRTIYKKVCKREGCSKSIDGSSSKFCSPSCAFRHSTTLLSGLNNKNALKGLAKSFIAFPQPHLGVSVVQHRPQSSTDMSTDAKEKKDQDHHEAIRSLRRQIDVVDSALEILKKREEIFKNTLEKCEDLLAVAIAIQVDGEGEAGEKKKKGRGRGRVATNGNGEGGGGGKDERACGWGNLLIADDEYIRNYEFPQNENEIQNGEVGDGTREVCLMPRRKCDRHQGWQKIVERSLETEQQTMSAMRDKLNERISSLELDYQNQQSSSEARILFAARAKGVR